jgi:hypothetical protein
VCVIDVADAPFDEVLDRAARRARNAYLNAYFDRDEMAALIAELGRARGEHMELTCFFNDRRALPNRTPDRPAPAFLLQADTRCFPPAHMRTFLADFEATLLAAAAFE